MRAILIDWLMEVSSEFMMKRDTLHIAVNFIDRYLTIKNNHLIQIDLFKALLKDGQIGQEYYLKDGLHLNENGYLVLNTLLKKTLRAVENLV